MHCHRSVDQEGKIDWSPFEFKIGFKFIPPGRGGGGGLEFQGSSLASFVPEGRCSSSRSSGGRNVRNGNGMD